MASHYRFILSLILTIHSISTIAQIQAPLPISSESEVDIKNFTGIISERYANGSPSLWKTLKDGKAEGLCLEWYPNGTLRYKAYWKDGLGHGKWEYFHPNGKLRSESFYIADIAQGIYRSYHENGQLESDATYLDGKKDGVILTYYETGTLISRQRFQNDTLVIDEPIIFEQGIFSNPADNGRSFHLSQPYAALTTFESTVFQRLHKNELLKKYNFSTVSSSQKVLGFLNLKLTTLLIADSTIPLPQNLLFS